MDFIKEIIKNNVVVSIIVFCGLILLLKILTGTIRRLTLAAIFSLGVGSIAYFIFKQPIINVAISCIISFVVGFFFVKLIK